MEVPEFADKRNCDSDIRHLLQNGSSEAISLLVYRYYDDLLRYGCSFCRNTLLVEDMIQDLFCELCRKPEGLSNVQFIKAYLLTSLRRRIFRQLQYDRKIHHSGDLQDVSFPFEVAFSHEEVLIKKEQREALAARLTSYVQQLSPRQREAIYLRFYENLSYEAISQVMEITIPYLYLLIHKSIGRIRKLMATGPFKT